MSKRPKANNPKIDVGAVVFLGGKPNYPAVEPQVGVIKSKCL